LKGLGGRKRVWVGRVKKRLSDRNEFLLHPLLKEAIVSWIGVCL